MALILMPPRRYGVTRVDWNLQLVLTRSLGSFLLGVLAISIGLRFLHTEMRLSG